MITAIIPARSGSKRLPGKNIKKLAGKPLLFYTIDSVLGHDDISKVILSTDSKEYINLARDEYGNNIDYQYRPSEYASDHAKVYDEIKRLVSTKVIQTDWYIVCLPTCPLRNHKVVRNLLNEWRVTHSPLFSASENNFPTQFAFTIKKDSNKWIDFPDKIKNIINDDDPDEKLVKWLDFFSQGHHDDRTIAVLK